MEIEFDAAKDAVNRGKHGVSLGDAAQLDWDGMLPEIDARQAYGEVREIGDSVSSGRLYCVVFVRRDAVRRIISLRKANRREVDRYEKGQTD